MQWYVRGTNSAEVTTQDQLVDQEHSPSPVYSSRDCYHDERSGDTLFIRIPTCSTVVAGLWVSFHVMSSPHDMCVSCSHGMRSAPRDPFCASENTVTVSHRWNHNRKAAMFTAPLKLESIHQWKQKQRFEKANVNDQSIIVSSSNVCTA